jgi:hypothetical protein
MFGPAGGDLAVLLGSQPDVREDGKLTQRLQAVAEAPRMSLGRCGRSWRHVSWIWSSG